MAVNNYKELIVWQKSMELVLATYEIIKQLPIEEKFALADQMRRCVISIPSNIAEGTERNGTKEFLHFLGIANGSLAELMTQIELCKRLNYVANCQQVEDLGTEVGKMLSSLISKLHSTH